MKIINGLGQFGYLLYYLTGQLHHGLTSRADRRRVLYQMEHVGINSLPLVLVVGFFAGSIIAWQAAYQFKGLISLSILGGQAQRVIVMEIGPVLTALILAGRLGASITAEIGTMRVSEEIDALRTLSIDPIRYLVLPRFLGLVLMLPVLTVFSNLAGVVGAFVVTRAFLDITPEVFFDSVRMFFQLRDVAAGLFKAGVFGVLIAAIGCYMGLTAEGGSEGVGAATIRSFVRAAIALLVADYFLWLILF